MIAPGLHVLTSDQYHADQALGSSGAIEIVDECPAYYWHRSALNPAYKATDANKFDVGTAAHLMMLEPHLMADKIAIIGADDWRTKDAKQQRDAAREAGQLPLLTKHFEIIAAMREVLFNHPIAGKAFQSYVPEQSLFWEEQGVTLKCRPDLAEPRWKVLVDYKTVASANPMSLSTQAARMGWFVQAAWYLDGVEAVTRVRPRDFIFVCQDREPPYLVSVCRLDPQALEWGRAIKKKAVDLYARCLAANDWPGYREVGSDKDTAFLLSLPSYAQYQLADRQARGEIGDPE